MFWNFLPIQMLTASLLFKHPDKTTGFYYLFRYLSHARFCWNFVCNARYQKSIYYTKNTRTLSHIREVIVVKKVVSEPLFCVKYRPTFYILYECWVFLLYRLFQKRTRISRDFGFERFLLCCKCFRNSNSYNTNSNVF